MVQHSSAALWAAAARPGPRCYRGALRNVTLHQEPATLAVGSEEWREPAPCAPPQTGRRRRAPRTTLPMRGAILSGRSHADFHCLSQKNSKIYGEREPFRPHTPQQEQAPHPRISGNGPYGGLYVCRMCVIPAASSRIPGPIWPEISANDAVALRGLIVTGARRVCGCASGRSVNPGGTQVQWQHDLLLATAHAAYYLLRTGRLRVGALEDEVHRGGLSLRDPAV